jgi:hypothetical protein
MKVCGCLFLFFLTISDSRAVGQTPRDTDAELARKIKVLGKQIEELSAKKQELIEEQLLRKEKRFNEQAARQVRGEAKKKLAKVEARGTLFYAPGSIYPGYPGYAYGSGYQGRVARYPDRYYLLSAEANWMLILPTEELRALARKYDRAPVTVRGGLWQAKPLTLDGEPLHSIPSSETIGVESLKRGWGNQ